MVVGSSPRVCPCAPLRVCPCDSTFIGPLVTPSISTRTTIEIPRNVLSRPHKFTERTTPSCEPKILPVMWNNDHLTQEWLMKPSPILMSETMDHHILSSCIMTRRLMQPPTTSHPKLQWLLCHPLDNHHCSLGQGVNSTLQCFPPWAL